jgi:phosphoglycerate dehydrogenase-like enzyme
VNVGRGNAIDEEALAAENLAGAYLDVFSEEPLPGSSSLRQAPNVIIFPHASAIAPQYLDLFIDEFVGKFEKRYGR